MNKTFIILCLCRKLENGETLKIKSICDEYEISVPTFRRYILLLRNFFSEFDASEIIYDAQKSCYKLIMPDDDIETDKKIK